VKEWKDSLTSLLDEAMDKNLQESHTRLFEENQLVSVKDNFLGT
jgi:hypothetical protein